MGSRKFIGISSLACREMWVNIGETPMPLSNIQSHNPLNQQAGKRGIALVTSLTGTGFQIAARTGLIVLQAAIVDRCFQDRQSTQGLKLFHDRDDVAPFDHGAHGTPCCIL
jgi:hypothetical protein